MKRLLIYIIGVMAWSAAAAQVTCQSSDSLTVCRLLREAPREADALWFARRFVGVPYVAHTLEVNAPREQLVVNTRQLDCTTLVETVCALLTCHRQGQRTWDDYLRALTAWRYREGRVDGYTSRLHYFSDWIDDNSRQSFVQEIQEPRPPFTGVQTIDVGYMSRHPQAYRALQLEPALIAGIIRQEQSLNGRTARYIPKQAVDNSPLLRQVIHNGDILAITTGKQGLDVAHLGFAVWRRDGLHLLNASQLHRRVVVEPMTLGQYLQKHPSQTGIRVIRIN